MAKNKKILYAHEVYEKLGKKMTDKEKEEVKKAERAPIKITDVKISINKQK